MKDLFQDIFVPGAFQYTESFAKKLEECKIKTLEAAVARRSKSKLFKLAEPAVPEVGVSCTYNELTGKIDFTVFCESSFCFISCDDEEWSVVEVRQMSRDTLVALRNQISSAMFENSASRFAGVVNGFIPIEARREIGGSRLFVWYNGDQRASVFHLNTPLCQ